MLGPMLARRLPSRLHRFRRQEWIDGDDMPGARRNTCRHEASSRKQDHGPTKHQRGNRKTRVFAHVSLYRRRNRFILSSSKATAVGVFKK